MENWAKERGPQDQCLLGDPQLSAAKGKGEGMTPEDENPGASYPYSRVGQALDCHREA